MNKTYTVYMHIFPNGKKYVGITSQYPVEKRWYSTGGGYRKCPKMWKAIQKYGWENVKHVVIYEDLPKAMAEAVEMRLIKEHNTIRNGYNIEKGGNVAGTHSEETRRKISEANKGKYVSEETRKKLSKINKNKFGQLNPFFGHHHSKKTKQEHSEFMKGNQYNKGNHHTEEFKAWKSEQMKEAYSEGRNPRCKRVLMIKPNGSQEVFWSLRRAAEVAGVSPSCMHKYVTNNIILNGCQWRYENG